MKKQTVKEWIVQEQGKHFCVCGCGGEIIIKIRHHEPNIGIPKFITGHDKRINDILPKKWCEQEQDKHICACGCNEFIIIKKNHFSAGIPNFIQGHSSRNKSEETKRKIGKGNKGKIISEETKKKISCSSKGKVISKEHRVKISNANKGQKRSDKIKKMIKEQVCKHHIAYDFNNKMALTVPVTRSYHCAIHHTFIDDTILGYCKKQNCYSLID